MSKGYLADTWETYVTTPWKQGGNIKRALGPVAGAANVFWRGFDEALRAVSGQEYQAPQGIMGNTRRDVGALLSNVFHLRPLKAASNAWSIVSGDIPADLVDMVGGFRSNMKHKLAVAAE